MNDFSHDYVFRAEAQRDYDLLTLADQVDVLDLIQRICRDPEPDGALIHDLTMPPVELRLADDGRWAIVFNVVPSFVVRIFAITPSPLRGIDRWLVARAG